MVTFLKWAAFLFLAAVGFFAFAIFMGNREPQTRTASMSPQEVKSKAATIPYDALARTPARYTGQLVTFRGKVVQASQSGQSYVLRINVNKGKYDIWSDTIYVNYRSITDHDARILDGDIVQIWGEFVGIKSYTSLLGQTIQIPQVVARVVEGSP